MSHYYYSMKYPRVSSSFPGMYSTGLQDMLSSLTTFPGMYRLPTRYAIYPSTEYYQKCPEKIIVWLNYLA